MQEIEYRNLDEEEKKLVQAAEKAMKTAYTPYSNFPVGAAILTESGKIITGSNVENVSYSLTICAERVAVFRANAIGERNFKKIAVVTSKKEISGPCGACRQVLFEFSQISGRDFLVIMTNLKKEKVVLAKISELLPFGFKPKDLLL